MIFFMRFILILTFTVFSFFIQSCSSKKEEKIQETKATITTELASNEEYDSSGVVGGMFDINELEIIKSPNISKYIDIDKNEIVLQTEVSPNGNNVAILTKSNNGKFELKFWDLLQNSFTETIKFDAQFVVQSFSWHPRATSIFIVAKVADEFQIIKYKKGGEDWNNSKIFTSKDELRNLNFCPRPFVTGYKNSNDGSKHFYNYRLFFTSVNDKELYRIMSLTEMGTKLYQVVGPKESITEYNGMNVSELESQSMLPVAWHPIGDELILKNKDSKFYTASYNQSFWQNKFYPLSSVSINANEVRQAPNGLTYLVWLDSKKGVGIFSIAEKSQKQILENYTFETIPTYTPDGKGIICTIKKGKQYTVAYEPLNLPLYDVQNAFLFNDRIEEINLFANYSGLFRKINNDQLYQLYESELYDCGSEYSQSIATRPYLVTTDIFWELFGIAYQGVFIKNEKNEAIPRFWEFVSAANSYFKTKGSTSYSAKVFQVLSDIRAKNLKNKEVNTINTFTDDVSLVSGEGYQFSNLKPRGHYAQNPDLEQYFTAFKYINTIYEGRELEINELGNLPKEVKDKAIQWTNTYKNFIAESRTNLIWDSKKKNSLPYELHPKEKTSLFPLSWGIDNEILNDCVFHSEFEKEFQITGANGERMLPSGLDLAATLGNNLALQLKKSDFESYPTFENVIKNLQSNFNKYQNDENTKSNIYNNWINGLAVQWADIPTNTTSIVPGKVWEIKRLQTGLATWATLRHATILVNETGAAECGEGGFEDIILRAPKGFVEPDPKTFEKIVELFNNLKEVVKNMQNNEADKEGKSLKDGILERIDDCIEKTNYFRTIAEKELNNETITNEEYENIFYIGRVAEHNFLVFSSLANKDNAISIPDPMAKISEVYGKNPYLNVAVGNPLEWDQIIDYKGLKQIVKGPVYSYYEFVSNELINDQEWRNKVKTQEIVPWVKPYVKN